MSNLPRRATLFGAFSALALAAGCGNPVGSRGGDIIDRRVDVVLAEVERDYPGTRDLRDKSVGMLVIAVLRAVDYVNENL